MSSLHIITKGFKSMKCCRLLHFNILPLLLIKTSIMGLSAEVAEIMCIFCSISSNAFDQTFTSLNQLLKKFYSQTLKPDV